MPSFLNPSIDQQGRRKPCAYFSCTYEVDLCGVGTYLFSAQAETKEQKDQGGSTSRGEVCRKSQLKSASKRDGIKAELRIFNYKDVRLTIKGKSSTN